ncbi:uncharacterized protein PHACADRAFT_257913 [Phanerochaete carnosa HHB-10118-sp]|uniref:RING-type domain-containing protein n=1 Tax=Phanerochaete carnosa (strain HHB-10118-sp) TaxID=650164 RepID=K5W5I4_PHACS|nr:uncharacterized protein PHACADRAFT_257913 [Phanerochaete carnosa HHB-10118-sp]EKM54219.1 hypothetical protein PHACADRAFT_257913 [Phanerochaete carnosa HHB-10118-sp]
MARVSPCNPSLRHRGSTPPTPKPVAKKASSRDSRLRGKAKLRPPPAVPVKDVVEISSEDDISQQQSMEELKRQLEDAKVELEQLKRARTLPALVHVASAPASADLIHKLNRLEAECAQTKAWNKRLLNTLESHLSCDMCYEKMWQPYSLACGHTFCRPCLQDWFSTELAKHMGTHPDYSPVPQIPRQYREFLRRHDLQPYQRTQLMRQIQRLYDSVAHPDYTCPTCRKPVTSKPIEAFTVKNIVAVVAEAEAEESRLQGKSVASPRRGGVSKLREESPFSGFFPAAADLLAGQ